MIPSLRNAGEQVEQDMYSGIVAQLLSAVRTPTGICVSCDAAAVPLIKEMRRMGWRVPQDASVIGFEERRNRTTPLIAAISVLGIKCVR